MNKWQTYQGKLSHISSTNQKWFKTFWGVAYTIHCFYWSHTEWSAFKKNGPSRSHPTPIYFSPWSCMLQAVFCHSCNKSHKVKMSESCFFPLSRWWFQPIWNIWVISFYLSQYISENKKYLKPPTSDALKRHSLDTCRHTWQDIHGSSWTPKCVSCSDDLLPLLDI